MAMDETGMGGARRLLEIVVAPGCLGGETARWLAGVVGGLGFADLDVRVIDLGDPGAVRPSAVFAVPTYLLDGRVLCLGNPFEGWLVERLGGALVDQEAGGGMA